ncbi:hypothetical protein [Proteiniborus sp. MB09-C3]|uniref:hypothetical protein n=1 Tax=Proteiniborus sp. MB09-C3 TaxID=3050072 RepID=UPI00255472D2|nr:hypothetical protein [Proteiniborus sp. MB09-C3]WIV10471.1 hypothetical protein QO263_09880 [Proteiniborus sp. MB09-C3]
MKITGYQFKTNSYVQNNKQIKSFNLLNNKDITSRQNIAGFYLDHSKYKKANSGGNIGQMMSNKIKNDIIADKIAKKVARGEILTAEEKAKIMEIDPEKLEKAKRANERRKELESRLKNVKSDREARIIILEAKIEAKLIADKVDPKYGEYLMEAVNKAEINYNNKDIKNTKDPIKNILPKENDKLLDIKL